MLFLIISSVAMNIPVISKEFINSDMEFISIIYTYTEF